MKAKTIASGDEALEQEVLREKLVRMKEMAESDREGVDMATKDLEREREGSLEESTGSTSGPMCVNYINGKAS